MKNICSKHGIIGNDIVETAFENEPKAVHCLKCIFDYIKSLNLSTVVQLEEETKEADDDL